MYGWFKTPPETLNDKLWSVFTWRHGGHVGVPQQWSGGHVSVLNWSLENLAPLFVCESTLYACKRMLSIFYLVFLKQCQKHNSNHRKYKAIHVAKLICLFYTQHLLNAHNLSFNVLEGQFFNYLYRSSLIFWLIMTFSWLPVLGDIQFW